MASDYSIVLDTYMDDPVIETAIAAAMSLDAADLQYIEAGAPVSKVIPDCLMFGLRVKVDSDNVVWFEKVSVRG